MRNLPDAIHQRAGRPAGRQPSSGGLPLWNRRDFLSTTAKSVAALSVLPMLGGCRPGDDNGAMRFVAAHYSGETPDFWSSFRQDFEAETKRITGGKGLQVVYDAVGKSTWDKSLNCLAPRGLMALYGQSSGPVGLIDPQILNEKGSLYLTRPSLGHYVATREELLWRAGEVLGWIRDGKLRLRMEFEFPLKEAVEAHRALEGRKTTGKVLLIP
jgi:threonine dehydrogenase-like Zn-dependent dehydrogenase